MGHGTDLSPQIHTRALNIGSEWFPTYQGVINIESQRRSSLVKRCGKWRGGTPLSGREFWLDMLTLERLDWHPLISEPCSLGQKCGSTSLHQARKGDGKGVGGVPGMLGFGAEASRDKAEKSFHPPFHHQPNMKPPSPSRPRTKQQHRFSCWLAKTHPYMTLRSFRT